MQILKATFMTTFTVLKKNTRSSGNTINYDYDSVGNLKRKDDYASTYYYNGAKPNAVSSVSLVGGGSKSFSYDGNGNLTHENGSRTIWYNAFNKPTKIQRNGTTLNFYYGADQMRYKQVNSSGITTIYLGKLYEKITEGSKVQHRYFIDDIAVLTSTVQSGSTTHKVGFTHRDRLGSTTAIVDENGLLKETQSFDPFGKPREGNFTDKNPAIIDSEFTTRGFTDHEHLDDVKLIHMNGRGFDYELGRFLSVDPFVQSPNNSQSLNPYSYIMNNPMSGIDPTGYRADNEPEVVEVKGTLIGSKIPKTTGYKVSYSKTKNGVTTTVKGEVNSNGIFKGTSTSVGEGYSSSKDITLDLGAIKKRYNVDNNTKKENNEVGFKSEKKAARTVLKEVNGTSEKEHGGLIYEVNNRFFYGEPLEGEEANVQPWDSAAPDGFEDWEEVWETEELTGIRISAYYHTHGGYKRRESI